ncbi:MAG: hypothetical protein ACOC89_01625 [Candidatus Saliniplasma sp.]
MHPIEPLLIALAAIIIHEIFHYIPHIVMKTEFKRFVVSIKSIGFQISNKFMKDNTKITVVYLLPLSLSAVLFIDPYAPRIFVFGVVNFLWGLIDITTLVSLLTKSPQERVDWADRLDQKNREKAIIDLSISN